jgi:hypothetical protein
VDHERCAACLWAHKRGAAEISGIENVGRLCLIPWVERQQKPRRSRLLTTLIRIFGFWYGRLLMLRADDADEGGIRRARKNAADFGLDGMKI